MVRTSIARLGVTWALALALASCQNCAKKEPVDPPVVTTPAPDTTKPTADKEPAAPTGDPGTIEIKVKLSGMPPKMEPLDRKSDGVCAKVNRLDESVVVGKDGALANVAITIENARGKFDVPQEPLTVDQEECMYSPRVLTAMVGQPLRITNSDLTFHNVHAYKGENETDWFNRAHPPKAPPIPELAPQDTPISLRCDAHPWMKAFILTTDNPFHGVSDQNGAAQLEGVPSRKKAYTLRAWHEKYGTIEKEVIVSADTTSKVEVVFEAKGGD